MDTVSVIDTTTNSVIDTIDSRTGLNGPNGIVVNPSGTKVYVTNSGSNTVAIIDTATNSVVTTIDVGSAPVDITVDSSGTRLYVSNYLSNTVSVLH